MKNNQFFYKVYSDAKVKETIAENQSRKGTGNPQLTHVSCKIASEEDRWIEGQYMVQQPKADGTQEQPMAQRIRRDIGAVEPSIVHFLIAGEDSKEQYIMHQQPEKDLSVSYGSCSYSLYTKRSVLAWTSMVTTWLDVPLMVAHLTINHF